MTTIAVFSLDLQRRPSWLPDFQNLLVPRCIKWKKPSIIAFKLESVFFLLTNMKAKLFLFRLNLPAFDRNQNAVFRIIEFINAENCAAVQNGFSKWWFIYLFDWDRATSEQNENGLRPLLKEIAEKSNWLQALFWPGKRRQFYRNDSCIGAGWKRHGSFSLSVFLLLSGWLGRRGLLFITICFG